MFFNHSNELNNQYDDTDLFHIMYLHTHLKLTQSLVDIYYIICNIFGQLFTTIGIWVVNINHSVN